MPEHHDEQVTLDPATLPGLDVHNGLRLADIGEDGDYTLLMGHHDPEVAWAAYATRQVSLGNWSTVEDEPREDYTLRQGYAHFSRHSEGCDDQAKEVCAPCRVEDHDACTGPCLCEDDYGHDDEGPSASPVPCTCEDEYSWWVSQTKTGEPITWIEYDWKAARERREAELALRIRPDMPHTTATDDGATT